MAYWEHLPEKTLEITHSREYYTAHTLQRRRRIFFGIIVVTAVLWWFGEYWQIAGTGMLASGELPNHRLEETR